MDQRELAERLTLALEAEGREVFIDRAELKAGESFDQTLREAILGVDAMVFLVTPQAVVAGSYTLADLNIAQQRWRRPSGHVLPVMAVATPITALPSYLAAVAVLQPRGEVVAEIVAAVARLKPRPSVASIVSALAHDLHRLARSRLGAAGVGAVEQLQLRLGPRRQR